MPAERTPASTLQHLNQAWHQHQLWLSALMTQPMLLASQCLRSRHGEATAYRRIALRVLADQAALGYDALDVVQSYEGCWHDWAQHCPLPGADNWWQWQQQQRKRQQRMLLDLVRGVLSGCQVSLPSEKNTLQTKARHH